MHCKFCTPLRAAVGRRRRRRSGPHHQPDADDFVVFYEKKWILLFRSCTRSARLFCRLEWSRKQRAGPVPSGRRTKPWPACNRRHGVSGRTPGGSVVIRAWQSRPPVHSGYRVRFSREAENTIRHAAFMSTRGFARKMFRSFRRSRGGRSVAPRPRGGDVPGDAAAFAGRA